MKGLDKGLTEQQVEAARHYIILLFYMCRMSLLGVLGTDDGGGGAAALLSAAYADQLYAGSKGLDGYLPGGEERHRFKTQLC